MIMVVTSRLAAGLATAEKAKGLCWIRYLPGGPSTGNPATMTVFAGNISGRASRGEPVTGRGEPGAKVMVIMIRGDDGGGSGDERN